MDFKQFRVWRRGARVWEWQHQDIELPIPASRPLRPQMARLAAMAATGQDHGVIVWSDDDYGYALYPRTERKIPHRGLPGPTQE